MPSKNPEKYLSFDIIFVYSDKIDEIKKYGFEKTNSSFLSL